MKIAITNHHRALVGGTESYLNGVIPELERLGHQVTLFHEAAVPEGAPVIAAAHHTQDWSKLASFRNTVVFNNGLQSPEREYELADLAPVVHFAHNYHGTCISGEKTRKLPHAAACPRRFGPACLVQYLPRHCGGWNPLIGIRNYRTQSGRLAAIHRARLVLTASRHMEAEYRNHGITRIARAPLFVSQTPDCHAPAGTSSFRILFAGRMTLIKGAKLLAQAAPLIQREFAQPVEFTFAGDGPERDELRRLCPEAAFPGWLTQPELRTLAATHHVLAMPSIWPEPFGLTGMELGLPVAAFAVGGIPDWLTDGYNGALAAAHPPTPEAFAEAVVRCLKIQEGCTNMHNRAQQFTLARHMAVLLPALKSACES
jgi:glycosyltransferase involved in cell wall biosynthesis